MTDPTPTPTRAEVERFGCDQLGMDKMPDGEWVRFTDYEALRERAEAAEAELHTMNTAGIIEVAVRNPSVMEYMQYWEGRVERAERAEAAAWNDAIEAAGNLESIHGYSNAVPRHRIRALRRAAPTEDR